MGLKKIFLKQGRNNSMLAYSQARSSEKGKLETQERAKE